MPSPFHHEKRKRRTAQQYAAIFAARGGCCHVCKRKLGPADRWELDHIIPLSSGGTDDDANCAPCCSWCHDPKSDADTAKAAHIKRAYTKHVVPGEFRRSKSWRR